MGSGTTISFSDLADWLNSEDTQPLSLHQIIAEAYSILHAPLSRLAEDSAQLTGWVPTQKTITPSSSAMVPARSSTQLILSLTPDPLFHDEKIPCALTKETGLILVKCTEHNDRHTQLFSNLSTSYVSDGSKSDPEQKEDDRAVALNRFNAELKPLTSLESLPAIASLVETAKPYINRHRHNIMDTLGILDREHVQAWVDAVVKARSQALAILENEAHQNPQAGRELLRQWREQPLFADEYYVSWWTGRKNGQGEIDALLAQLSDIKNTSGPSLGSK